MNNFTIDSFYSLLTIEYFFLSIYFIIESFYQSILFFTSQNILNFFQTSLMFTWGSKALRALDTIVPVPHLKPGDTGTISVRLQIPSKCFHHLKMLILWFSSQLIRFILFQTCSFCLLDQPGLYECYFHFHHKGRRFGHWLGCQVVVDPFDLKGNKSVLETSYLPPFETASRNVSSTSDDLYNISNPVTRYEAIWEGMILLVIDLLRTF